MLRLGGGLATLSALFAALRWFPPETTPFYPLCPIHAFTRLLCPGCGATRALAALTHGAWLQALHQNALAVALLPALAAYLLLACSRATWPALPRSAVWTLAAACVLFTVIRNLG